jgi:high-affinity Fe2+/Pb2+ permease
MTIEQVCINILIIAGTVTATALGLLLIYGMVLIGIAETERWRHDR